MVSPEVCAVLPKALLFFQLTQLLLEKQQIVMQKLSVYVVMQLLASVTRMKKQICFDLTYFCSFLHAGINPVAITRQFISCLLYTNNCVNNFVNKYYTIYFYVCLIWYFYLQFSQTNHMQSPLQGRYLIVNGHRSTHHVGLLTCGL